MTHPADTDARPLHFSGYQKFVIAILAFLQFTIILDFMILSPLGAMLMPALNISPSQFGLVVSGYAFSAGIAGILAAGFADRFDRKKLLLFFYTGFIFGTLLCGLANDYVSLLIARMVTGIFGGVVGSIGFAIITDLFAIQLRGRVMGIVQTAFAASQILGIPMGLFLANHWGWHFAFFLIVAVGAIAGLVILTYLKPITGHLNSRTDKSAFHHLIATVTNKRYVQGFLTTALLSTGGFMIMPFSSAFTVHNMGIEIEKLPMIYMASGIFSIASGLMAGKLSDTYGKFNIFCVGSVLTIVMMLYYTHLGITPIYGVIAVNILIFAGISARMISSSALMSALPAANDRGSYMSISSSLQQISGGFASALAGMIVTQDPTGKLLHFNHVGYVISGSTIITMIMMYFINDYIQKSIDRAA